MTISAINSVKSNYKFNAPAFTSEPEKTEDKKEIGNTGKALILTGLAALAATGIYLATRGRGGSKNVTQAANDNPVTQGVSDEVKALKEKIATLKDSIKTKYSAEREKIDDAANGSQLNIFQRNCLEHAKSGKPNADRIKSVMDFDRTIKYIKEAKHHNDKSIADWQSDISNYPKVLKAKLQELSNDSDWIELRKLRHKIQISQCKDNDDFRRLELIDEVLFSKANNETSAYLKIFNLSVEDAIKLIKSPNTYEEFKKIEELVKKTNPVNYNRSTFVRMNLGYKISVNNLYLSGDTNKEILTVYHDAKMAPGEIKKFERTIADLLEQKQNYQQKVIDLANKTRQSAEVKELKKLVAKLKELEK